MDIVGWVWSAVSTFLSVAWATLGFIPFAQSIVVVAIIALTYWFLPQFLRDLIRPILSWIWSVISPPLRWGAVQILKLLVRLAGEEAIGASRSTGGPERITVYKTSWAARLRWSLIGAASLLAFQNREMLGPYVIPLVSQLTSLVTQYF